MIVFWHRRCSQAGLTTIRSLQEHKYSRLVYLERIGGYAEGLFIGILIVEQNVNLLAWSSSLIEGDIGTRAGSQLLWKFTHREWDFVVLPNLQLRKLPRIIWDTKSSQVGISTPRHLLTVAEMHKVDSLYYTPRG